MPLFSKNYVLFVFFTYETECEKGKHTYTIDHYNPSVWIFNLASLSRGKHDFSTKVIVLSATSVLIFQYKYARKTSFKKYYKIALFELL